MGEEWKCCEEKKKKKRRRERGMEEKSSCVHVRVQEESVSNSIVLISRFAYLRGCGCVISEKALKEVPSETCHKVLLAHSPYMYCTCLMHACVCILLVNTCAVFFKPCFKFCFY